MMLTYSKEEKNDTLIEKFFLGYPNSLTWAQHLSWAGKFRFHFLRCVRATGIPQELLNTSELSSL